jgi:hypothetical protein
VVFIRERIEELGRPDTEKVLGVLSTEERATYDSALTLSWVPDQHVAAVIRVAAQILYPGLSTGIREIGRSQALADLGGIYRVLLAVSTVSFALGRTAQFWKTFNKQGTPRLSGEGGSNHASLVVSNYPGFPPVLGDYNCGYIIGVIEAAGAKVTRVTFDPVDASTPRWSAHWE